MTIKIPNTPSLAAFSWCTTKEDNLIVLGGSDGNLLNSDLFIIDMLEETCEFKPTDFEFSTGMGHLLLYKDELYHIGGFNSFGVNYKMKMGSGKWQALTSSHSHVTNQDELELTSNTSVSY